MSHDDTRIVRTALQYCPGRHADEVEVPSRFRREQDPRRGPKVEYRIGRDPVSGKCLVDDDFQSRIAGPVDELEALVRVMVDDDGHTRDEHEDGPHGDGAVVAVVEDHECFLFRRLTVLPLMVGYEDAQCCLVLPLEGQSGFHVEVPAVSIERRDDGDARFPRYPPAFLIAPAIEEVDIRLVLDSQPDPRQQTSQFRVAGGADLLIQHDNGGKSPPQGVSFVVLAPLLYLERILFKPRDGCAGQQDRPLLYGTELVEVATEEHYGDPSKVL
ncbi:hypothetical protein HZS61_011462 [Fusarium oxysporum f. sp. conglutinans]|uniref:Uncharacterized protein n=1 Tax=Fusarium oxysporum f. sp. conglutinans TaxID=100902 RepID=A0A8H6GXT8_FUSOX|nr:hypothetical protein HZS61_011462 [Fusarium oxysporum f. sp. conglutinans]